MNDGDRDRKSTRLNSSHQIISYAVFCLKKKSRRHGPRPPPQEHALGPRQAARPLRPCRRAVRELPGRRAVSALRALPVAVRRRVHAGARRTPAVSHTLACAHRTNGLRAAPATLQSRCPFSRRHPHPAALSRPSLSSCPSHVQRSFFFFNNPATPEFYPLPPHAAFPI